MTITIECKTQRKKTNCYVDYYGKAVVLAAVLAISVSALIWSVA